MTHAELSAESEEHNLYKEHVNLQEQMGDAVKLLKYLKDEKGNYEDKIWCS